MKYIRIRKISLENQIIRVTNFPYWIQTWARIVFFTIQIFIMAMSRISSIPVRKISLELNYKIRTCLDIYLYLYPEPDDDSAPDTLQAEADAAQRHRDRGAPTGQAQV